MSNLIPFNYQSKQVRTIIKDNEPWFVAKDICEALEIGNITDALSRIDLDEKGFDSIDTPGGSQMMYTVNEPGLYSLILGSRKPEAKPFKRWITHEVLPTIRKTGGYIGNDEAFIKTYLPFADETTKSLFRSTLETVRKQNELILKQQKEIEYKEDVIINLIDEVELAEKRQVLNRVVRHNNANFQERWRELYKQFEMKYHIDLNIRLISYNSSHKPKLKSKLEYIDKILGKLSELYEIACKLYESDIKELTEHIFNINKPAS
jgi:prophage antirepressor-like protein